MLDADCQLDVGGGGGVGAALEERGLDDGSGAGGGAAVGEVWGADVFSGAGHYGADSCEAGLG